MNNPFEHNSKELPTGFYFDKRQKCIAFHFVNQEDDLFSYSKTYNRFYRPNNLPAFMLVSSPQDSNTIDLVDLELDLLMKDRNILAKDFSWINSNYEIAKTFVEFLLSEEKYLILELFKTFTKTKQNNGK